ncbi:hypothetical protein [Flavihumibacter solisilvae]|uniref:Uncharacterized protein n=1 Tax=Flavihumibacter solisilvae TaxID=1349421 RepID=A0A0C1L421_9BACT|nr:hypothetical protein [Flavihumibacter solisilvae]KIC94807.1 hypothetical protein OI18_10080 [Flavihumibacter solisilvae]
MSDMEDDARDLLVRTLMTVSLGSLWLLINSTFGLMFGWFFFDVVPTLGNYIFYAWFLLSLGALVWYFIRLWKKKFPIT